MRAAAGFALAFAGWGVGAASANGSMAVVGVGGPNG